MPPEDRDPAGPAAGGSLAGPAGGGSLGAAGLAVARGDAPWPDRPASAGAGGQFLDDLEPVGVGGVLDGGFELLRRNFGLLFGVAAALLLPLQLIDLGATMAAGHAAELQTSPFLAALGSLNAVTPATLVVSALRLVVLSFLGLLTGVLVAEALDPRGRPVPSLVAVAARRWWVALLVPVLCTPVKAIGGCLFYVGFFLGDALLMCASVVAGAERAGPLQAFARSWTLGWRSFGTALGVSFGSFVISAVLQISLYAGPALLASLFVSSEAMLLAVQQIALLALLVTQPLTAAIAARAYLELRCRSEALDLALRRRRLEKVS